MKKKNPVDYKLSKRVNTYTSKLGNKLRLTRFNYQEMCVRQHGSELGFDGRR